MDKKLAIVTGAAAGIGLETARGLVAGGYHVVLAVRDVAKGEAAAREIGGGEVLRLDVADLESVRAFASAFTARYDKLHVLVNNAGIHTAEWTLTPQGIESTFATNHLGHFLLTKLLLDALKRGAPARIVNVASEAHRFAGAFAAGDVEGVGTGGTSPRPPRGWSGLGAYAHSKLANIQFTYALARRIEGTGVAAFAVHPGSVRSGWARGKESGPFRFAAALASPFLISPDKGARTSIYAATSPVLDGKSGLYLMRGKPATPTAAARDVSAQDALWELSETLCER